MQLFKTFLSYFNARPSPSSSEDARNISLVCQTSNDNQIDDHCHDLALIRDAFRRKDVAASKSGHASLHRKIPKKLSDKQEKNSLSYPANFDSSYIQFSEVHHEHHVVTNSDYLKAIVFGGLDGVITIFAVVSGCVGVNLSVLNIIILGIGNLFADAVSMAFSEYNSAKVEYDFMKAEKSREEWEVDNCPEEEKNEMIEIYMKRYNFTEEDAISMVNIAFKYRRFFIEHMMVEELGIMTNESDSTPFKRGLVMFFSFTIFGLVPLICFIVFVSLFTSSDPSNGENTHFAFWVASIFSILTLFILGIFKGRLVTQNPFTSGLLMAFNGTLAGSVAYGIGRIFHV